MEEKIYASLKNVVDPEIGFDVVSLGLIYGVLVDGTKAVVTMTLSTQACPLHEMMLEWVESAVLAVDGIDKCEINLVWEPAWNIEMASEEVKAALA